MSTLPPLTIPSWVPAAVADAAQQLHVEAAKEKDPAKAVEVLSLLVSDSRMRYVWRDLYKKNRRDNQATQHYYYPAYVTNASNAARLRQLACELRNKVDMINERDAKLLESEAAVLERLGDPPADPRWSEQDRAVQLLLRHAYRNYLDVKPVFLSDLKAKMENWAKLPGGYASKQRHCSPSERNLRLRNSKI